MKVCCPHCKHRIGVEDVNVSKDTVYCSNCGSLSALSSLLTATPAKNFDVHARVRGITLDDRGANWMVSGSHRSLVSLFLVPFTLVWAGGSMTGIYGSQIIKGEFEPLMSLFGLPFLVGSIVLVTLTLMSIFGRTLVSVENNEALIFIGLGSIGWYRRFNWRDVERVTENKRGQHRHLSLEGRKRLNLGWGLGNQQRYYLVNLLRSKLQR